METGMKEKGGRGEVLRKGKRKLHGSRLSRDLQGTLKKHTLEMRALGFGTDPGVE